MYSTYAFQLQKRASSSSLSEKLFELFHAFSNSRDTFAVPSPGDRLENSQFFMYSSKLPPPVHYGAGSSSSSFLKANVANEAAAPSSAASAASASAGPATARLFRSLFLSGWDLQ